MADQDQEVLPALNDSDILPDTSQSLAFQKGEIEQQVSTARKYPRQLAEVSRNILELAGLDAETAQECTYTLQRDGKAIVGPSIRFAEILCSQFGNCRAASMVTDIDRKEGVVVARGVFHDLEKNVLQAMETRRGIRKKGGGIYSADMIVVTGNAAGAIAKRNAILAGVPKALWRPAWNHVMKVVRGDAKTLVQRRFDMVNAFGQFEIKPAQVFQLIGVQGLEDIDLEMMVVLGGYFNGLKSGETTMAQLFPEPEAAEKKSKPINLTPSTDDRVEPEATKTAQEGTQEAIDGSNDAKPAEGAGRPSNAAPAPVTPDTAGLNPMVKDAMIMVDSLKTWKDLSLYVDKLMKDKKFWPVMDADEHLPLWEYIKSLPVWEEADKGSIVYGKIMSGF